MTWGHLQQLRQAARNRIEERRAALQPRAGAGASVSGSSISLFPQGQQVDGRGVTWTTLLYVTTRYRGYSNFPGLDKPTWDVELEPELLLTLQHGKFEGYPAMIGTPAKDTTIGYSNWDHFWDVYQEIEVRFESRSYPHPYGEGAVSHLYLDYEDQFFRFPIHMTVEGYYYETFAYDPQTYQTVVQRQRVTVGRNGAVVKLKPAKRFRTHYLRVTQAKLRG